MREKMHDIIATSNKMEHPNIFLTTTCNPNCRKFLAGQTPQDRPDLCARVLNLKLKALMEAVINDKIVGEVVAHVMVIEFRSEDCLMRIACSFSTKPRRTHFDIRRELMRLSQRSCHLRTRMCCERRCFST